MQLSEIRYIYRTISSRDIASTLGVSHTTVLRYIAGVTPIPEARAADISRYYYRHTYEELRATGFGVEQARLRAGISPDRIDYWTNRMTGIIDELVSGAVAAKAASYDIKEVEYDIIELYEETEAEFYAGVAEADLSPDEAAECLA